MTVSAHLGIGAAKGILVDFPFAVIRNKQIHQTVVVIIDPKSRDRPNFLPSQDPSSYTRLVSYIAECAVPVVVQKLILRHIDDIEIGISIIIVIANGSPHSITTARHTGFGGHVAVRAIAVIMKEAIPVYGGLFVETRNRCPIHKEDIQITVIVVIQQCHTRHHGFGLILVWGRRAIGDESEPCARGEILKGNSICRSAARTAESEVAAIVKNFIGFCWGP